MNVHLLITVINFALVLMCFSVTAGWYKGQKNINKAVENLLLNLNERSKRTTEHTDKIIHNMLTNSNLIQDLIDHRDRWKKYPEVGTPVFVQPPEKYGGSVAGETIITSYFEYRGIKYFTCEPAVDSIRVFRVKNIVSVVLGGVKP